MWMGQQVTTLADLLPDHPRAICVGINPSPVSVAAGHYYQGRLGQSILTRLRTVGLIPDAAGHEFDDDVAFRAGVGFTDIIKRPTERAEQLRPEEYAHGRALLMHRLTQAAPDVVIFTFKKPATKLFKPFTGCGLMADLTVADAKVFVMPGPYEKTAVVAAHLDQLRACLAT
jgi:TDG/mug DNA glycosylase family protein